MTTTVTTPGTRTLCQHPGCGVEIEQAIGSDEWVHIDSCRPDHWATPVEPAQPVEITCPTPRCDSRAWRMPDGNAYFERIGGVPVLPEEPQRAVYGGYYQ